MDRKKEIWKLGANCLGSDPELFFPARGEGHKAREAMKICGECMVANKCLEYALENNEQFGIFGGKSERQRRRIRYEKARADNKASLSMCQGM